MATRRTIKQPTKEIKKPRKTKAAPRVKTVERKQSSAFDFLRLGESYSSLVLGIIVVVIATILLLSFVHNRNSAENNPQTLPQNNGAISPTIHQSDPKVRPGTIEEKNGTKTYTISPGDDLWKIAEKVYGDGDKWGEIADANNLANPSVIHAGVKLTIPNLADNSASTKITGSFYKIQKGDNLWTIAVRAYGDGYRWVEIAKRNKLTNPSLIHVDNTLIIPRK